jgi:hypothetical protein
MTKLRRILAMTLFGFVVLASGPAARAAADPAEIAFWQSAEASKDPQEYRLYLQAYPNGVFAPLARLRLESAAAPVAPIPLPPVGGFGGTPAPATAPAPDADPSAPALTITPASGRVGQIFTIGCVNLPENSSQDVIIVVRAGSPVLPPGSPADQMRVLTSAYSQNCKMSNNRLTGFGPYAPGNYEARFMSVLYNDDKKFEMKAKAAFTVH